MPPLPELPTIYCVRAHTHNRLFSRICRTSGSARAAYNVAIACAPKSVVAGMSKQSSDGGHPALHNETTALRYLRYARYTSVFFTLMPSLFYLYCRSLLTKMCPAALQPSAGTRLPSTSWVYATSKARECLKVK